MPRTTTVHLLTGDYPDRLAELVAVAEKALNDSSPRTMLEQQPDGAVQADHEALRAEAIAAGTTVHLAALGRTTWRKLKESHPIRTDGDEETIRGDRLAGVNVESAEDDLVYEAMRAWQETSGEKVPAVQSRAAFEDWADKLSEGEWQVLVLKAWELTNGARLDPKELPSLPTTSDEPKSK